jgi:hypothetical protein
MIASNFNCGVLSLFIFLEKTKQKSVVTLESLRFQGRSPRQVHASVIDGMCYRTDYLLSEGYFL